MRNTRILKRVKNQTCDMHTIIYIPKAIIILTK